MGIHESNTACTPLCTWYSQPNDNWKVQLHYSNKSNEQFWRDNNPAEVVIYSYRNYLKSKRIHTTKLIYLNLFIHFTWRPNRAS